MSLTWLFFSLNSYFLGVPQNGNRGLTYCVTQKQVPEQGNGPWKVSATILVFCIPLVFLPPIHTAGGAMSRKTSNGEQRLDVMCLKGASGTPLAIKHSCDSPDAIEQAIVAIYVLAGVTVIIKGQRGWKSASGQFLLVVVRKGELDHGRSRP